MPFTKTRAIHAGGTSTVNVYLVNIYLPNNLVLRGVRVTECEDNPNFGIIIGMDIITAGDFCISNLEEEPIFFIVEEMPDFQGKGVEGFREYVAKNLNYPDSAANNGISGRVFISFIVEPDGSVNDVIIARGADPSLDEEALRVVKSSPKWTPGKQRGRLVRVAYTFPIEFMLQ
ncbi:hypothetical protein ES705_50566 [subsurface metagenome]